MIPVENPSVYQAPGDVVVDPESGELMVVYAPGSYKPLHQVTAASHIARIDGDMERFAGRCERLQWEGAKRLVIRRSDLDSRPEVASVGREASSITMTCEGRSWAIRLFDDVAPKVCAAISESLPIEAPVTNTHSSGMILHFWGRVRAMPDEIETGRERRPVVWCGSEVGTTAVAFYDRRELRGFNPGDVFYCDDEGFLILHGQGQFGPVLGRGSGRFGQAVTQKVGCVIDGSVEDLSRLGDRVEWEGAKTMILS